MRWPWISRREHERVVSEITDVAEREIAMRCANIRDLEEQVAHWYGKFREGLEYRGNV